ncbi:MAG: CapA family protein [Bacteroidota bacterium]|nr:CapA family protein [Bacteroidota bacterium]
MPPRRAADDSTLTLIVAGDVLLDRGVRKRITAVGADRLFDGTRRTFRNADAVLVNLECAATDNPSPFEKMFVFRAEPEWVGALRRSGITHADLANNHAVDHGPDGFVATMEHLRAYGLVPVGGGPSQDSACSPVTVNASGVAVALFATVLLPLENWMHNPAGPGPCQASVEETADRIRRWKSVHPCGHAVAVLHWGREYQPHPTEGQRAAAALLAEAGADIVIGHHPHVAQSIERIGETMVVYSTGNFVFDQSRPETRRCFAVELTWRGCRRATVALIPFLITDCSPRPMTKREAGVFRSMLLDLSEGIALGPYRQGKISVIRSD